ncbi:MAG: histidinol dehydrogenase [Minwuia sp.]|nr:histidinol dehydrogenase [Minwuia sp.]
MLKRLDRSAPSFDADFESLLNDKRETSEDVDATVTDIIATVRRDGDAALIEYTRRFDRMELTGPADLRFTDEEIVAAEGQCAPETLAALDIAAGRIEAFHARQRPADDRFTDDEGVVLGARWTAISAVGLYVPGGTASYPSSVLMNAIPARVAGVERVAMVVPTPDGVINPLVIAAARRAGVSEIYRLGGAQAVAALAYGTNSIAPVDKIVGPGNAWVAAAKRRVFGQVGIDMIAGPSEILVVADGENDPAWIAADLLSQSEHDVSAQAILITNDPLFADRVAEAVESHLQTLDRSGMARQSWESHGAIILVGDLDDAPSLVDRLAPEHLELAVSDPEALMARVRNAGAIFLGRYTPEAIGDYVAGPNHVLPTARSARFSSGLNLLDFMKRTTFVGCDADSLRRIGPAAATLADAEGLTAHALSVRIRNNG